MRESVGCDQIERLLACGEALNEEQHQHVLQCQVCQESYRVFEALDVSVERREYPVDDAFADRVMSVIEDEQSPPSFIERIIEFSPARVGLVMSALFVVASLLVRFICATFVATMAVY